MSVTSRLPAGRLPFGYSKNIRLVSGRGEISRWAPALEVTGHEA